MFIVPAFLVILMVTGKFEGHGLQTPHRPESSASTQPHPTGNSRNRIKHSVGNVYHVLL